MPVFAFAIPLRDQHTPIVITKVFSDRPGLSKNGRGAGAWRLDCHNRRLAKREHIFQFGRRMTVFSSFVCLELILNTKLLE